MAELKVLRESIYNDGGIYRIHSNNPAAGLVFQPPENGAGLFY